MLEGLWTGHCNMPINTYTIVDGGENKIYKYFNYNHFK